VETNLYRAKTKEWLNDLYQFKDAIFISVHYSEYLKIGTATKFDERLDINKRFLRNLEKKQKIKGGRNRLKRLVVMEGKESGNKHCHMIIEIPENKDYREFSLDCFFASNLTKGFNCDFGEKHIQVYEQSGLIDYLTKESNYNIDNIDTKNSRY